MNVKLPPGPPPIPNNVFAQLRFLYSIQNDLLETFRTWSRTYGDIHYMQFGKGGQYTVSHPDLVHELLVKQASKFNKSADYKDKHKGLARFLGNGLVVSDGDFWKRQRRL